LVLVVSLGLLLSSDAPAEVTVTVQTDGINFSRDIQPIFADRCYSCHGAEKRKGGLRLDRKADAFAGGDNGKAILPGKSAESRLIRNVSGLDPDTVMPPKGERLTSSQIATLRQWIDQGAPWPDESWNAAGKSQHWAFKVPQRPAIRAVRNRKWLRNPIDAFVLTRLEKEKITPSTEADKITLIRRLSVDLLGLPPTLEEVKWFVADTGPYAYDELVDRMLRSPYFGERWARHWLDLARYADSDGYEKDGVRPYAWLYRDWVIDAINRDIPFDQFSIAQIAGDLLPDAKLAQKTATGFHRQTLTNKEGGVDPEEFRCKATVDRASTTAAIWLGLTVGCAECHSHKYDPITQKEFYQFYAFFNNTTEQDIPLLEQPDLTKYKEQERRWNEQHAKLTNTLNAYLTNEFLLAETRWEQSATTRGQTNGFSSTSNVSTNATEILSIARAERTTNQQSELIKYYREQIDSRTKKLDAQLAAHQKKQPKPPEVKAAVLVENDPSGPTYIHVRGDFLRKGEAVEPGTFSILHPLTARSSRADRLDMAQWLFDPANPLTARVTVNHIWLHLFGRGLVNTVNDFGTRGDRPSHPELLDWLASEWPRLGWSRKALIRLIVTSATYRQTSALRPELIERDPNNILLARQSRFRSEAEVVRDSFLSCSGLLETKIGGPSIRPPLPADIAAIAYANSVKWNESEGADRYRRGLYIFLQRTIPYPMLTTFDAPDSNVTCTRRERSNTPLQALTLLNDSVFFECAQTLGKRLALESPRDPRQQVKRAFEICLGRSPTSPEMQRLLRFYEHEQKLIEANPDCAPKIVGAKKGAGRNIVEAATLVALARTVLNLDEFLTRE